MLKLLRTILILLLALSSGVSSSRGGDSVPSEAQMKAAFLLNFPKYVEWPASALAAPSDPIIVAVLGDDGVAGEFAAMSNGKTIDGHPIKLIRNPTSAECLSSHILFIGPGAGRKTQEIVSDLKSASVLTVGESDQFMDQGGMINLALRERRIAMEVNLDATRQTELKISSKLMALAKVRGGRK